MNKICARCEKTVYPIEELKCLDKIWHKQCFKCQGCGMTLNMRTYKGFNKQPYCEAHIPKAKATTMAETPELKRIAENTKIQSNVKYHADFEKSKGKFTQVADDPETLRIKANSKIISNVAYHGDLEKKAIMEQKRTINENGDFIDEPVQSQSQSQSQSNLVNANVLTNEMSQMCVAPPPAYVAAPPPHNSNMAKISDSPYSSRQHQTVIYTSDRGSVTNPPSRKIGSIADLDPVNNVYGSLTNSEYQNQNQNFYQPQSQNVQMMNQMSHNMHQQQMNQQKMNQNSQQMYQQHQQSQPQPQQVHQQSTQQKSTSSRVYRALYDYEAQDSDEVSFCDGDLIINVTSIDSGWMTGQVQRTGEIGMLPANYVEVAHI